jgi:hypothetical protein
MGVLLGVHILHVAVVKPLITCSLLNSLHLLITGEHARHGTTTMRPCLHSTCCYIGRTTALPSANGPWPNYTVTSERHRYQPQNMQAVTYVSRISRPVLHTVFNVTAPCRTLSDVTKQRTANILRATAKDISLPVTSAYN